MSRMVRPLDDPTRVTPGLVATLEAMLEDPRPAYRAGARAALAGLDDGTLVGLLRSGERAIVARKLGTTPAEARHGALFQCVARRSPPRDERDLVGWILVADDYAGGAIVLVHEIAHYRNRLVVGQRAAEAAPLLGGVRGEAGWVRAQFLNELAARHTAYLAEEGAAPDTRMPAPGALFACAVKIASYPAIYNDNGVMAELVGRGDDELLRDQVGLWMSGLAGFRFFDAGSALERAHAAWLDEELRLAQLGRRAPRVPAEGTL